MSSFIWLIPAALIVVVIGMAIKMFKSANRYKRGEGGADIPADVAAAMIAEFKKEHTGKSLQSEDKGIPELRDEKWPYQSKNVLSPSGLKFLALLKQALPHKIVFAKVSLNQVLSFPDDNDSWAKRIAGMSLDYVVCNADGSVLFVVELGKSSKVKNEPNDLKEKVLREADILLIRWSAEKSPDVDSIRETVQQRLKEHRQNLL